MKLNADLTVRAVAHAADMPWVPSPTPGVDRRMLDRDGDEVARATSVVRYAPGSRFPAHVHGGGEEFLVLDGSFEEEGELFKQWSWLRLPRGSSLVAVAGADGCRVWMKTGHLA